MDGHDDSPASPGVATLNSIEAHIIRTTAAAHAVDRLVDEALSSTHPDNAARRHDGIALLLDVITFTGLSIGVVDLLRHVHAAHDAVRAAQAAGGAR